MALGCGLALAESAAAGEKFEFTAHYGGYDKSEVMELGADHVLFTINTDSAGYFLDPPHDKTPMQHAAGPCRGIIEIKDGKASGHGYCLRTNPEGGRWLLAWEVAPDTDKGVHGSWKITGVSGNAEGWKGAGTWDPIKEIGGDRYAQTMAGWLEKPDN